MVNARDIESRIDGVKNVRQITRTMKAVASAKLNRAQDRIERARAYAHDIGHTIRQVLARHSEIEHEFFHGEHSGGELSEEEDTNPAYIILTGDRGLCGSYNSNIFRRAEKRIEESSEPTIYCVGEAGANYFTRYDEIVRKTYSNIWDELDYERSFPITDRLIEDYLETDITSVTVIYNEFESAMVQHIREYPLLPLNRADFYSFESGPEDNGPEHPEVLTDESEESHIFDYKYEPNAEMLIDRLFPRHVRTQVYTTMLEAYAALQGARMIAMDNATENANEMIDELTLEYNQVRQSSITREIADITGGAEALREDS
ncbi:MAG: ATP synthase F1 subunit gamma [bacterium]